MSNVTSVSSQPEKSNRWNMPTAAALALSVALAGGNAYLLVKTDRLETQMKELKAAFKTELVSVQQDVASRNSSYSKVTEDLRKQIEETGERSAMAANAATRANNAAKKYSDDLSKKLVEQQRMVHDQHVTLATQLGEMKDASTQTYAKVDGLTSDVTNVKTEVASTKNELDKTIADLRSVRATSACRAASSPPTPRNWPPCAPSANATTSNSTWPRRRVRSASAMWPCS